jgi:hypothetical protein
MLQFQKLLSHTILCFSLLHSQFTNVGAQVDVDYLSVGTVTCQQIWDGVQAGTYNPAECSAIKTMTTAAEDPCGCQEEVGSNNFCAEPEIESSTECDMCQGSGPLSTNPSNIIENGV